MTKEEQVLELIGIVVIKHLAQQTITHCITHATGELIEHLILIDHSNVDAIDCTVQGCDTLSLLVLHLIGNDE